MKKPELLAPAGSWESLIAAVENGADAVYLGGQLFNARQSAANFNDEEIAQAVRYAHYHGVKIYVTANILVSDEEMKDALYFLYKLQTYGVDAVIVQDAGLAYLAGKILPELSLHASTQMTIHNTLGVKQLLNDGFSRIVLARELELTEIEEIKKNTHADIEVFIHGALCISYSGQCLMSSMIGGRSGNRGRCAQPCRLNYKLLGKDNSILSDQDITGEYLLSPKDLNISGHLPELIAVGIDSFKIEGRMKKPEYVATVVNIYRRLIDRAFSGQPYWVSDQENEALTQIFNRDFTTGYFFGGQGKKMMSYKRPNNRGIMLGRVKGINHKAGLVEVSLDRSLYTGDGLEIWVTEGGRVGFIVGDIFIRGNKVEIAAAGDIVEIAVSGKIKPGDRVFKTFDSKLMQWARNSFNTARGTGKKIPLAFEVQGGLNKPLLVTVKDPEGRVVKASTETLGQLAKNRPIDEKILTEQLIRLGNTPFELSAISCDIQGKVIYPLSEINQVRRKIVEAMKDITLMDRRVPALGSEIFQSRLEMHYKEETSRISCNADKGMMLAVTVGDINSYRAAVEQGADIVYFGLHQFRSKPRVGRKDLIQAADICRGRGLELILQTPRVIKDKDMENIIELIKGVPVSGVLAGNLGIMSALRRDMPEVSLIADYGLNAFNKFSVNYLLRLGAHRVAISPELTVKQVNRLSQSYPVEVLVQGAMELMVTEHCVIGACTGSDTKKCKTMPCIKGGFRLKDRTGAFFPVESDDKCRMHLFNSRDLCLLDDLPELYRSGVCAVRIEAAREGPGYVKDTVKAYRAVIDAVIKGDLKLRHLEEARKKMTLLNRAGLTKGHFYRGV